MEACATAENGESHTITSPHGTKYQSEPVIEYYDNPLSSKSKSVENVHENAKPNVGSRKFKLLRNYDNGKPVDSLRLTREEVAKNKLYSRSERDRLMHGKSAVTGNLEKCTKTGVSELGHAVKPHDTKWEKTSNSNKQAKAAVSANAEYIKPGANQLHRQAKLLKPQPMPNNSRYSIVPRRSSIRRMVHAVVNWGKKEQSDENCKTTYLNNSLVSPSASTLSTSGDSCRSEMSSRSSVEGSSSFRRNDDKPNDSNYRSCRYTKNGGSPNRFDDLFSNNNISHSLACENLTPLRQ